MIRILNVESLDEEMKRHEGDKGMQRETLRRAVRQVMEPVIDVMAERILQILDVASAKVEDAERFQASVDKLNGGMDIRSLESP